jgi:predicted dehydrogenase
MVRVGFIGLGKMGRLHLMTSQATEGVETVAAADTAKSGRRFAEDHHVPKIYSDYRKMLETEKELDAVVVTVPNFLHFECVKAALEGGYHVFVEKPLARNLSEAAELSRLSKLSGRFCMIGHSFRFVEAMAEMRATVDRGIIGSLEAVTLEEVMNGPFAHGAIPMPVPEWWFDKDRVGGGVILDLGYHMIDLFRFFAGEANLLSCTMDHRLDLPIEDKATLVLRSVDGNVTGTIHVGWYQRTIFPDYNFRAILHGTAKWLTSDDFTPPNLYLHAAKEVSRNLLRKILGLKIQHLEYTYYLTAYAKEIRHFYESIERNQTPCVTAEDGVSVMKIIDHAYKLNSSELLPLQRTRE